MESSNSMSQLTTIKQNTEKSLELPPTMSELRIILLGKDVVDSSRVGNLILGRSAFETEAPPPSVEQQSERARGQVEGRYITLINTPHLLHPQLSVEQITLRLKECVSLAAPGPHALLLLIQPESFTQEEGNRFRYVLDSFSEEAATYAIIIVTDTGHTSCEEINYISQNEAFNKFIYKSCKRHCILRQAVGFKHWRQVFQLLETIDNLVKENGGHHLTCESYEDAQEHFYQSDDKPTTLRGMGPGDFSYVKQKLALPNRMIKKVSERLNVVLCGSDAAVKASISDLLVGQRAESSSVCVKREAEVCGHLLTLVEMPALYNTHLSEEQVMQQTLHCVSLCPPGVHAFLLVIAEGRLTDEDKAEMEIIQNIFSSRVLQHTIVLLSQETQQEDLQMDDATQLFIEACGGRHHVMFSSDPSWLLQAVQQMVEENKGSCYTTDLYRDAQVETQLKYLQEMIRTVSDLKTNIQSGAHAVRASCAVRMVLVGKTGVGKSAAGNTILGNEVFNEDLGYYSITRACQRETAEVDGRQITVIDTPGLFDTEIDNDEIKREISKSVYMTSPGPHVFLLMLKVGQRHSKEEREAVKIIQELFGEGSINYTMLLFTRGDELKNKSIEECFGRPGSDMMKLVEECGNRYHVFNNKERRDHSQVTDLLHKIYNMVEMNGGSCYTNQMFQQVEIEKHEEQERILRMRVAELEREKQELIDKHKAEIEDLNDVIKEERRSKENEKKRSEEEFSKIYRIVEIQRDEFEKQRHEDQSRREKEQQERREWEEKCTKDRTELVSQIKELKTQKKDCEKRIEEENIKQTSLEEKLENVEKCRLALEEELQTAKKIIESKEHEMMKKDQNQLKQKAANEKLKGEMNKLQNEINKKEEQYKHTIVIKEEEYEKRRRDDHEKLQLSEKCRLALEEELQTAKKTIESKEKELLKKARNKDLPNIRRHVKDSNYQGSLQQPDTLRIILLGKTGVGKSATGNTILGKDVFHEDIGGSVTIMCQKESANVNGRQITVIDTPGLFDTNIPNMETTKEITKCISMAAPGPHVFLLVLSVGSRFTQKERDTVNLIKETFGEKSQMYTMVLFSRGDLLKGLSIEQYIEKCGAEMKKLLYEFGNRYHVFNNNENKSSYAQVSALLDKIDSMIKVNGGSCYTNEMFQQVETELQKNQERILMEKQEEIEREKEELKAKYEAQVEDMKKEMEKERERQKAEANRKEEEFKEKEQKMRSEFREQEEKEREYYRKRREENELMFQEKMADINREKERNREQLEKKRDEEQRRRDKEEEERRTREEEWNKRQRVEKEKFEQEKEMMKRNAEEGVMKLQQENEEKRAEEEKRRENLEEQIRHAEESKKKELREQQLGQQRVWERRMKGEEKKKIERENEWKKKIAAMEDQWKLQQTTKQRQYKLEREKEKKRRDEEEKQRKEKEEQEKKQIEDESNEKIRLIKEQMEEQKAKEEKERKEKDEQHKRDLEKLEKQREDLRKEKENEERIRREDEERNIAFIKETHEKEKEKLKKQTELQARRQAEQEFNAKLDEKVKEAKAEGIKEGSAKLDEKVKQAKAEGFELGREKVESERTRPGRTVDSFINWVCPSNSHETVKKDS